MNWTINQTVDLSRGYTPVVWPDALMVSGDVGAHTWRLTVLDNGVPADLSGATITGSFLRADGNTVLVSGTVSGNIASVTLTDVCYAVEGKMKGTIKMTKSGAVITLAAVIFTVSLFTSGSVIDPGVAYADFQIDASPKGVYANLAALNAGTPTAPDVTKIYVTDDDKKWCYHNGAAWVAGGVYQAAFQTPLDLDKVNSTIINTYGKNERTFYLEEGDADGANLYFKIEPWLIRGSGYRQIETMAEMATELGVSLATSAGGVGGCIMVPNNNALIYDILTETFKFRAQESLVYTDIIIFINKYGRADYLHNNLLNLKTLLYKNRVVDVRAFCATGNGTTDDTAAIQSAIEYAKTNGGEVYFPKGTYMLSSLLFNAGTYGIASALMVYDGMTLRFDAGAVLKRGSAAVTHMLYNYNAAGATGYDGGRDITIIGATIDANGTGYAANITPLNFTHATRIKIRDCRFVDGYGWHYIEVNSCTDVEISGCEFSDSANSEDVQIDAAVGAGNLGADDGTVCTDVRIFNNVFIMSGVPAIGNHTDAAHNNIRIYGNTFSGDGGARGYITFVPLTYNVDVYNNTFSAGTKGVTINCVTVNSTVHDNRFIGLTTDYSGGIEAYNNMIDGVFTP